MLMALSSWKVLKVVRMTTFNTFRDDKAIFNTFRDDKAIFNTCNDKALHHLLDDKTISM